VSRSAWAFVWHHVEARSRRAATVGRTSRHLLRRCDGQSSIEVLGAIPLMLVVVLACAQLLTAGAARVAASSAANAAAMALLQGGDAAAAARAAAPGWTHPAKLAVDGALRRFGFRPPAWYEAMKAKADAEGQDPAWLGAEAAGAGFTGVRVAAITVPTGLSTPAQLASWRLGLAHYAPFLRSLEPARRAAARRAAEEAAAVPLAGGDL